MKIYTKTGDSGETSLFGGGRVGKDHYRIAAYGTLDELNAILGVVRAELVREASIARDFALEIDALFEEIQNRLFDLGAELATPQAESKGTELINESHVERLEIAIDHHDETLPPLKQFILPGGSATASQLHLARCVCRRAERRMVTLARDETVRDLALRYVNRLSDLLFVAARAVNQAAGMPDVPWNKAAP